MGPGGHERLQQASQALRKTKEVLTKPSDVEIVARLIEHGIRDYVSVACSVTDTIDDMWSKLDERGKIQLIRTVDEDNLPGIAAGIWLGAGSIALIHTQNSGLLDMGHGIVTFARSYKIPILALVTWRGNTSRDDSEVHQEIGTDTAALTRDIFRKNVFGTRMGRGILHAIDGALEVVNQGGIAAIRLSTDAFHKSHRMTLPENLEVDIFSSQDYEKYQQIVGKKGQASNRIIVDEPIARDEAIERIVKEHPNAAILFPNGYTSRAAQAVADRLGNFYNTGYMGGTLAIGWSLAKSNPDIEVVVVDGDQNAQRSKMKDHLAIDYPEKLYWYILNNGIGASVGTAKSLPLKQPWYYELGRVILTIPDQPKTFGYSRVKGVGAYFETDEAKGMEKLIGPLPYHTQRFKNWVAQQTERNKRQRVTEELQRVFNPSVGQ